MEQIALQMSFRWKGSDFNSKYMIPSAWRESGLINRTFGSVLLVFSIIVVLPFRTTSMNSCRVCPSFYQTRKSLNSSATPATPYFRESPLQWNTEKNILLQHSNTCILTQTNTRKLSHLRLTGWKCWLCWIWYKQSVSWVSRGEDHSLILQRKL